MIPRKSHGDGSYYSPCSLHDGDHSSLQVARRRSLFGYKINNIDLENELGDVSDGLKIAIGGGFGG